MKTFSRMIAIACMLAGTQVAVAQKPDTTRKGHKPDQNAPSNPNYTKPSDYNYEKPDKPDAHPKSDTTVENRNNTGPGTNPNEKNTGIKR